MSNRLLLILCLTMLSLSAHGDSETSGQQECLRDDLCRAQYTLARELSKNGRLSEAVSAYEAAYQRRPVPILLFNIGRLFHRLNHYAEAVRYYSRYLDTQPPSEAEQRARARQFLDEATQQLKHSTKPSQAQLQPPPPMDLALPDAQNEEPPPAPLVSNSASPAALRPSESPISPQTTTRQPTLASARQQPSAVHVDLETSGSKSPNKGRWAIHKKWWFWTVLGVGVAGVVSIGATVGTITPSDLQRIPLKY